MLRFHRLALHKISSFIYDFWGVGRFCYLACRKNSSIIYDFLGSGVEDCVFVVLLATKTANLILFCLHCQNFITFAGEKTATQTLCLLLTQEKLLFGR